MSQFSSNPTEEHLQKALYIVHYLSSSKDLCIVYFGTGDSNGLCAYSDIDWAGDVETSWSTTGYAIFLGNGIVSWLSRQQQGLHFLPQKQNIVVWLKLQNNYTGSTIYMKSWDSD